MRRRESAARAASPAYRDPEHSGLIDWSKVDIAGFGDPALVDDVGSDPRTQTQGRSSTRFQNGVNRDELVDRCEFGEIASDVQDGVERTIISFGFPDSWLGPADIRTRAA